MPEQFRRTLGGFDPAQVRAALEEREVRLAELEREAQRLARRLLDAERRAQGQLGPGDEQGAIAGLGRRLEEIHAQARRQATRIRMNALQDAVQIADRVTELSRMRDELGARVGELAAAAGVKLGSGEEERAAIGMEPSSAATDGLFAGSVEVEVGPLRDFAQLTSFEDAASAIESASEVRVQNFADGRATFSMNFAQPVELVRELEQRAPFEFHLRDARADGIVLDIDDESDRAA